MEDLFSNLRQFTDHYYIKRYPIKRKNIFIDSFLAEVTQQIYYNLSQDGNEETFEHLSVIS